METKADGWGTKQHRLQVYLPIKLEEVLDKYITDQFSSNSRVVSGVIRKALEEYLEKRGYLENGETKSSK